MKLQAKDFDMYFEVSGEHQVITRALDELGREAVVENFSL